MSITTTAVYPPEGTLISRSTPVTFTVTATGTISALWIAVAYSGVLHTELVHDGTAFLAPFTNPANSKSSIAGGFTITLLRDGGWPATPRILTLGAE